MSIDEWNTTQPQKVEILPFVTRWMDLEGIMLCEINQIKKDQTPYDFTYMWNLKNKTNE